LRRRRARRWDSAIELESFVLDDDDDDDDDEETTLMTATRYG
jgi:hypothetical protein